MLRRELEAALSAIGAEVVSQQEIVNEVPGDPDDVLLDVVADEDGILEFEPPLLPRPVPLQEGVGGEERSRSLMRFGDLPGNSVFQGLEWLDEKLTPTHGLRRLHKDGTLTDCSGPPPARALLLVHGTFSNSETVIDQMQIGDSEFLQWALGAYPQVLTYDYPTLSCQAIANGLRLHRLLRGFDNTEIDVISHSQGGLVVRYWLEVCARRRLAGTRSVFVGGTLAGTSLAAPPALRGALKLLGNYAKIVTTGAALGAGALPLFGAVAGIAGVLEKTLGFFSAAPALDGGVAMIPGLQGMSRVGNNAELRELRETAAEVPPGYFAVTSAYEPPPATWKIWKGLLAKTAGHAAKLLFDGPNDLVVDTEAQSNIADGVSMVGDQRLLRLAPSDRVDHMGYFRNKKTLDFLGRTLGRPTGP